MFQSGSLLHLETLVSGLPTTDLIRNQLWGFPGGSLVGSPPASAGWVRLLIKEDPRYRGATEPVSPVY